MRRRYQQRFPDRVGRNFRILRQFGIVDRGNRAPEVEGIFGFETDDERIGHRHVQECKKPRGVDDVEALGRRCARDCVQWWNLRPSPVDGNRGLLVRALGARARSEPFDFVEVFCECSAGYRRRTNKRELFGAGDDERLHVAPLREDRIRVRRRSRLVYARSPAETVRLLGGGAVILAQCR